MGTYTTHDVPVRGGLLRVGRWQGEGPVRRVVLAVHGITATHVSWELVGRAVPPGTMILAPDLRGRGRSGSLPGPSGMSQHATDCLAVLTELADGRCDVAAGHSMGGFVVATLAGEHPEAVGRLLLVDGGVPFPLPPGADLPALMQAALGPAVERLSVDFASHEEYQAFWRQHPAFSAEWNDAVAAYVDYDLGSGPPYRSTVAGELITQDYPQMFVGGETDRAWPGIVTDALLLRAPRGLMNEPGGLYPPELLDAWAATRPRFVWREVPDVNHYTLVLGRGADVVNAALGELLA
ncbi:alpha/beta hydrolase [Flexivirga caeni]|nr:alpha/beta hydrolase [Flexivirga caeni]